jgi:cobalt-zinc-cadmium efflux system outer membrane protein
LALALPLVVVGAAAATNEDTPVAPLAPEALVAEALDHNAELGFYQSQLEGAQAARRLAGRLDLPKAEFQAGQIRSRNLDQSLAGEGAMWAASVRQSFEWPGRLGLRKAIANQDVALATLGLEAFRRELAGKVRENAFGLAGAEEKARVAQAVADRFRALREVLVQRDPAGIAPQLEVRILEATELTLRRRASEFALAVEAERVRLNLLRGSALEAPLRVKGLLPELPERPPLDRLMAAANTNHFDLRTRAAELVQQGFRVDLARHERWPAFEVGPMTMGQDGSTLDRIVGVGVSFPLPLWQPRTANIAAAEARQKQAEALLAAARREVERRVVTAARGYDSRLAELSRWRPDVVAQFESAAELADRHYRLGAVPATTYVELQKQYLDAVEAHLDTRREALGALLELEQATGLSLARPAATSSGASTAASSNPQPARP